MSIGNAPSALGTLLVQRLDAVLGTTLAQQSNLVSGARPDAVSQPGHPERPDPARNDTVRHPQENVNRTTAQVDPRRQASSTQASASSQGNQATPYTSSATTTLGPAARIILELLNNYTGPATIAARLPLIANPQVLANSSPPVAQAPTSPAQANAAGTADTTAQQTSNGNASATSANTTTPLTSRATASLSYALPSSTPLAAALAQSLHQAIDKSGIFYESHLTQLYAGRRTVADLRAEPQAQHAAANAVSSSEAAPAQRAAIPEITPGSPPGSPPPPSTPSHQPATAMGVADLASTSGSGHLQAASPNQANPIPTELQALVRTQLEVLANQALVWRGEVWPQAEMEWEIQRHAQQENVQENQDFWATKLKLTLPNLGVVDARLTLMGQQIIMHIEAPASASLLSNEADQLRARLSAIGMQLSQLDIISQAAEQG